MLVRFFSITLVMASLFVACDTPPPPSELTPEPTKGPEKGSKYHVDLERVADRIEETSAGIALSFVEGRIAVTLPPGFSNPDPERSNMYGTTVTRCLSRKGSDRIAMISWNEYQGHLLEGVWVESMLNVMTEGAQRQMVATIDKEEDIQFGPFQGRRILLRYPKEISDADKSLPQSGSSDAAPTPQPSAPVEYQYARYEYVIGTPYLFQLSYDTPSQEELTAPEVDAFFASFQYTPSEEFKPPIRPMAPAVEVSTPTVTIP